MNKNDIIKNGVYKDFLEVRKEIKNSGFKNENKVSAYEGIFDIETTKNCLQLYNAQKARKRYGQNILLKWIYAIDYLRKEDLDYFKDLKIVFGTLTFKNEVLDSTSKKTRRRYVSRFLNDCTNEYLANIDYGKENEREHYHFLAVVKGDISKDSWRYGWDYYQNINVDLKSIRKARNYILKLNNHSYKESTHQDRILKSRKLTIIESVAIQHEEDFYYFQRDFKNGCFND